MDRCPEAKAAELQQEWKRPNSCRQASSVRPGASSIPVQVDSAVDRLPEYTPWAWPLGCSSPEAPSSFHPPVVAVGFENSGLLD